MTRETTYTDMCRLIKKLRDSHNHHDILVHYGERIGHDVKAVVWQYSFGQYSQAALLIVHSADEAILSEYLQNNKHLWRIDWAGVEALKQSVVRIEQELRAK